MASKILPDVLEDIRTNLAQTFHNGQDVAKYIIRAGLGIMHYIGGADGTSIVLCSAGIPG